MHAPGAIITEISIVLQQAQTVHFSEMMIILMVTVIMTKQLTCVDLDPILRTLHTLPHLMLTVMKWVLTDSEVK